MTLTGNASCRTRSEKADWPVIVSFKPAQQFGEGVGQRFGGNLVERPPQTIAKESRPVLVDRLNN